MQLKEFRRREEALDARERELDSRQAELDRLETVSAIQMEESISNHIDLLRDVLHRHTEVVEELAKRRPDSPMSLWQIRTVNEILSELKDLFTGSEAEDFLHLAEEPEKDGTSPGTTYGEMALLLSAYSSMLLHFAVGRLSSKHKK